MLFRSPAARNAGHGRVVVALSAYIAERGYPLRDPKRWAIGRVGGPAVNEAKPPEIITRLSVSVFSSFAMLAGTQLDVFTPLEDGPLTAGSRSSSWSDTTSRASASRRRIRSTRWSKSSCRRRFNSTRNAGCFVAQRDTVTRWTPASSAASAWGLASQKGVNSLQLGVVQFS